MWHTPPIDMWNSTPCWLHAKRRNYWVEDSNNVELFLFLVVALLCLHFFILFMPNGPICKNQQQYDSCCASFSNVKHISRTLGIDIVVVVEAHPFAWINLWLETLKACFGMFWMVMHMEKFSCVFGEHLLYMDFTHNKVPNCIV